MCLDGLDGLEGGFRFVECDGVPASSVHGVLVCAFPLAVCHCSPLNLRLHIPHLRQVYVPESQFVVHDQNWVNP